MATTPDTCTEMESLLQAEQLQQTKFYAVMAVVDPAINVVNDAVIPLFGGPASYEYPSHVPDFFTDVINQ